MGEGARDREPPQTGDACGADEIWHDQHQASLCRLGIGDFGGLIGHNAAIFGYTTAMFYWPEVDAIIVLAGNQASNFSNATTEIAIQLAEHLSSGKVK